MSSHIKFFKRIVFIMTLSTSFFLNESKGTLGAEDLNVLIIGGGLAGLSTAKALENIGLKPTVIERREAYKDEGAGIAIPANGSWALKALGISIEEAALRISTMTFMTPQGDILAQEDVTKIHPQGAQFYAIDRTHLLSVLKESLVTTNV